MHGFLTLFLMLSELSSAKNQCSSKHFKLNDHSKLIEPNPYQLNPINSSEHLFHQTLLFDNLIPSMLSCDRNISFSQFTSSLPQGAWAFPSLSESYQVVTSKNSEKRICNYQSYNSTSKKLQRFQLQWTFYLKQDKIISATLKSSVNHFLQVHYLEITTTFTNTLILKQKKRNLQAELKNSLCIPPKSHDPDPVTISLHLLKPSQLLHHKHNMFQNITQTTRSNPSLLNLTKYLKNNMEN